MALQLTWFEPMQVMSEYTACRVFDIKEELSIAVGTSKLVDRIEDAGLCRRRANPDDRRSHHRAHACRAAVAGEGGQVL
jgi:hypothetical protein